MRTTRSTSPGRRPSTALSTHAAHWVWITSRPGWPAWPGYGSAARAYPGALTRTPTGLLEDDRAVAVQQDPVLGVPDDGAGQDLGLDVTARLDQARGGEPVVHAHDALLDDRPLVQVGRHVVRGRADELDALGVRLGVRLWAPDTWEG